MPCCKKKKTYQLQKPEKHQVSWSNGKYKKSHEDRLMVLKEIGKARFHFHGGLLQIIPQVIT